jgi:hypothetical protein
MTLDRLEEKRQKAQRYAAEPERFTVQSLHLRMQSEHGVREIAFHEGRWSCTCPFYVDHQTCSHIMAAQQILMNQHLRPASGTDEAF